VAQPPIQELPVTRATRAVIAVLAATLAIGVAVPVTAGARTISDARAEAARIERQIQQNGDRIAALGEQYNGAVLQLQQLEADHARAVKAFKAAEARAHALHASVAALAVRLYTTHSAGSAVIESIDTGSVMDYTRSQQYTAATTSKDIDLLDHLRVVQAELTRRRQSLDSSIGAARAQRDRLSSTRQQIEQANQTAQRLLAQTKGELGRLIHEEEQRQQAAQEAAAKARAAADAARRNQIAQTPQARGPQGPDTPLPPAPPPSAGVAKVIAYARAQLGKPYVYNTAGPDTFDCSGLTMMAWAQVGVSMPHYSGSQYSMFPHVALSEIQPGDLLFKGPGGSAHVSLYVGGGMQIAATHTGSFVLLQPVNYASTIGASRP
jgi:cell wall-associated NlpC family hydrolase